MISEMIKRAMLAGLGAQEKIKELTDELIKKGELSQSQGAKIIKEWTDVAEKSTAELSSGMNELVVKALQKMNLPTKEDLDRLNRKVQSLSLRIKRLEGKSEELEEKSEAEQL
jgi:polyhydroxyalkanoate synthesis regulator phasin